MSVQFTKEDSDFLDGDIDINIKPVSEFRNDYHVEKKLGAGAFAEVYLAEGKQDNNEYAIKIIDRSQANNPQRIWGEIKIQQSLTHPNIIKLYKAYANQYHVVLVLEYAKGGELYESLLENEGYSEKDAVEIIKCLLIALDYLHKNGIVHRDIKPENILFAKEGDQDPKLGDFGLSGIMKDHSLMFTCAGTPIFMAPEVISGKGYGTSCDMWSVGVLTYLLLSGKVPFNANNPYQLFKVICSGEFGFGEEFDDVSESARDFIKGLICTDVNKRMTAAQALQHPWITEAKEDPVPLVRSRGLVLEFLEQRRALRQLRTANTAISFISKLKSKVKLSKTKSENGEAKDEKDE